LDKKRGGCPVTILSVHKNDLAKQRGEKSWFAGGKIRQADKMKDDFPQKIAGFGKI
jgi:hypothetical protein